MHSSLFIAWQDVRYQMRQGSTLLWVLAMPPVFFYFIGTMTGGFQSSLTGAEAAPLTIEASTPGFLASQLERRLEENGFAPTWVDEVAPDENGDTPWRVLSIDDSFTAQVVAGNEVDVRFETKESDLGRDFEIIRIQRSLYTLLADVIVAGAGDVDGLTPASVEKLNDTQRTWQLDVSTAGERREVPRGFQQAIPGMLVMFTLLVLLTSGGSMLVLERQQGLLRRLASAPISRGEVVAGKLGGRMVLAAIQVSVALAFGTLLFSMDWGPDIAMIAVVLAAWAAFCASAGLLIGSLAATEGQASGLGVLIANVLAALGGCWWPIEITPGWMQMLQQLLPTGWTMNALHKLISFQSGAASAIPEVIILVVAALLVGLVAVKRFKYE